MWQNLFHSMNNHMTSFFSKKVGGPGRIEDLNLEPSDFPACSPLEFLTTFKVCGCSDTHRILTKNRIWIFYGRKWSKITTRTWLKSNRKMSRTWWLTLYKRWGTFNKIYRSELIWTLIHKKYFTHTIFWPLPLSTILSGTLIFGLS